MRSIQLLVLAWPAFAVCTLAASRDHVIHFGVPTQVQWFIGAQEESAIKLKVRPLYVDGKLKEFTTGQPRDITDHAFVVCRVYRVNDRLPSDTKQTPKWKWQRAGWLLVDRPTGRVTELRLPEFDPFSTRLRAGTAIMSPIAGSAATERRCMRWWRRWE